MNSARLTALVELAADLFIQTEESDAEVAALRDENTKLKEAVAQRDETIAGLERHLSIIERDAALHGMQAEPHA